MPPAQRILLVEDNRDIAEMTGLLLQQLGYEVVVAPSVAAAITEAHLQRFDLLLSDFGLPDGNGCDVLAALAPLGVTIAIAVTAYGDGVRARCQKAGFSSCMAKPVEFEQLQQAIASALGDAGERAAASGA